MMGELKGSILVVDDTPESISMVQTALVDAGYEVLVAITGEKALKLVDLEKPDLILLDVMMPGMDGYETCRRLKAQESTQDIPVIFLSAMSETIDKVKGFDLGGVDYLNKPIALEELLVRVNTHVKISRLEKDLTVANKYLEKRVAERTIELSNTNAALHYEITERRKADEELNIAFKTLTEIEQKLRLDFNELVKAEEALLIARRKADLMNQASYTDIQNYLSTITGCCQQLAEMPTDEKGAHIIQTIQNVIHKIGGELRFANEYQGIGITPPTWQNIAYTIRLGIAPVHQLPITRDDMLKDIEVYADPLLAKVFFILAENIVHHGVNATDIAFSYQETDNGLILTCEDNGIGIPDNQKESIFENEYPEKNVTCLFLAREILSITGIFINERGTYGKGTRFEILIPRGGYKFVSDLK